MSNKRSTAKRAYPTSVRILPRCGLSATMLPPAMSKAVGGRKLNRRNLIIFGIAGTWLKLSIRLLVWCQFQSRFFIFKCCLHCSDKTKFVNDEWDGWIPVSNPGQTLPCSQLELTSNVKKYDRRNNQADV
jgi:hypothetical protein